jgi:hypothetical protein
MVMKTENNKRVDYHCMYHVVTDCSIRLMETLTMPIKTRRTVFLIERKYLFRRKLFFFHKTGNAI